jgi:phenylpropionate dioxygenase-like ring-hydroxylating dioxygenase large terminal subunit
MFESFPNLWTPVLPLTLIDRNPMPAEIAGEKLVIFKDTSDEWHVLLDKCPHRGAALSLGDITPEGEIRCAYHGWRYKGDGSCARVPMNDISDKALAKIHATALPTRLIGGCVWIYTSTKVMNKEEVTALPGPLLPKTMQGNPEAYACYPQEWQAHWTRAFENFIDFTHPPYLHQASIGGWMHDFAEGGAVSHITHEETDYGYNMTTALGESRRGFPVEWYQPNMTVLHFGDTPYKTLHVFCVPVNATHTRVMNVRMVPTADDVQAQLERCLITDKQVLDEDRAIVESQHGCVLSDPAEISVAGDSPSLIFRKWYKNLHDFNGGATS